MLIRNQVVRTKIVFSLLNKVPRKNCMCWVDFKKLHLYAVAVAEVCFLPCSESECRPYVAKSLYKPPFTVESRICRFFNFLNKIKYSSLFATRILLTIAIMLEQPFELSRQQAASLIQEKSMQTFVKLPNLIRFNSPIQEFCNITLSIIQTIGQIWNTPCSHYSTINNTPPKAMFCISQNLTFRPRTLFYE